MNLFSDVTAKQHTSRGAIHASGHSLAATISYHTKYSSKIARSLTSMNIFSMNPRLLLAALTAFCGGAGISSYISSASKAFLVGGQQNSLSPKEHHPRIVHPGDHQDGRASCCDDAYTKLQEENPDFKEFWVLVDKAIEDGCSTPPCQDIDGRNIDAAEFDRLYKKCQALGADPWVDSYQANCTGTANHYAVKNWLDCVPKECNVAAHIEKYTKEAQFFVEDNIRLEMNDSTCDINFQAQMLEEYDGASSFGVNKFCGHGMVLIGVALLAAFVWM